MTHRTTRGDAPSAHPRVLTRRRLLLLAGALAACALPVSPTRPALAEPDQRGAAETTALTAAQQQYEDAKQKLADIGSRLEQTKYELDQTTATLTQLGYDIDDTESGIESTTNDLQSAQDALAAYLEISYKSGVTSTLDLLMQSTDFNDFVTRSYYVEKIQDSQVSTINDIKDLKSRLEQQHETLSEQQDEETQLKTQLEQQRSDLTARQNEASSTLAGLSDEVKQLFDAQQAELQAAAAAKLKASSGAASAAGVGVVSPSVSQGSVVNNAYACLGIPYVWGGDDTNIGTTPEWAGYDCSGMTQHCYALEGYEIGRTTWDQIDDINALGNWKESVDELQPGDLVFPNDGHVGIYIGNHQMIDAPYPGMFVRVDDVTDFIGGGSPV